MRQILGVLVVVLALAVPASARAEHVDWSQYVDTSAPAKASRSPQERPARTAKASRSKKKIAKAHTKSRPKMKARAARKRK